jgi:mRNA interferase MazF
VSSCACSSGRPRSILRQRNTANVVAARNRAVITVVPVTSNTARVHSFQVLLPAAATGLPRDSKAQAEQLRSVSAERIQGAAG